MEYLPAELLFNIFHRLCIDDIMNCRLVNKRFNNVLKKNWSRFQLGKEKLSIQFVKTEVEEYYFITSFATDRHTSLKICANRIEVSGHNDKQLAELLAQSLDIPDARYDARSQSFVVYSSGINELLKVVLNILQLKMAIQTLEIEDISLPIIDILVEELPNNSIRKITFCDPKSVEEVLTVMNKFGMSSIKTIELQEKEETSMTQILEELLPEIPFKSVQSWQYICTSNAILTVIKNWLLSNWTDISCCFLTNDDYDWKRTLKVFQPQLEVRVHNHESLPIPEIEEIFSLKRQSDHNILRVLISKEEPRQSQTRVKLFDDEQNVYQY